MKLNLTIELPLKDPAEVLDMDKVRSVLDSNFVNSLDGTQPFKVLPDKTADDLANEAYYTSTIVQKMADDIQDAIGNARAAHSERIDFDVTFPPDLVREHPDLPLHWHTARNGFNSLQESAFYVFDMVQGYVTTVNFLKDLVRELFAQGLPGIDELRAEIGVLEGQLEERRREAAAAMQQCKETCEARLEQMRLRIHEKDKLVNAKDKQTLDLERRLAATEAELREVQGVLADTNAQVANKYSDFQELNKYIGELFKDKRKAVELMEEKDKLIAKLQADLAAALAQPSQPAEATQRQDTEELIGLKLANEAFARRIDELEGKLRQLEQQPLAPKRTSLAASRLLASQVTPPGEPGLSRFNALANKSRLGVSSLDESRYMKDYSVIAKDKLGEWLRGTAGRLDESKNEG